MTGAAPITKKPRGRRATVHRLVEALCLNPMLKIPRRPWGIAFLLAVGVLVNYFDRVNVSVAHAALITPFAISNITFGYLSAAYNWTYALCQLPVGVVLDKFGVRRIGRISSFLWSVASFAASVAPN